LIDQRSISEVGTTIVVLIIVIFFWCASSVNAAGSNLSADNHSGTASARCSGRAMRLPKALKASPQETWVWEQVCGGSTADLNRMGKPLNPILDSDWSGKKNRILRHSFLETILLQDPYRNAVRHCGVRIVGALFEEPIDLSHASLHHPLKIGASVFKKSVDFSHVKSNHFISLADSKFYGKLDMHGVKISDDLELSSSRSDEAFSACGDKILKVPNHHPEFTEIDLQGADISGSLYLSHAKADRVNLHHINVGGSLWVDHMGDLPLISWTLG